MDNYPFLVEKLLSRITDSIFYTQVKKDIDIQDDYIYIHLEKSVLRMHETPTHRIFEFNIKANNKKIYFKITFEFINSFSQLYTAQNTNLVHITDYVNQNLLNLLVSSTHNIFLRQKSSMVS